MEGRNPVGYERQKLYSPISTASQRVATHADMMASAGSNPMFFVVDIDEETGKEDALYYWSGIEARYYDNSADLDQKVQQVETDRLAVQEAKEEILAIQDANVTVDTYAQAVPLFSGSIPRRIDVRSDTVYNEGDPSHYTYNPEMPEGSRIAFLGIDYNYTEV